MMDWLQYVIRLNPKAVIRNSEEHLLLQQKLRSAPTSEGFRCRLLAVLGRRLADWGEWLLEQYDSSRRMTFNLSTLDGIPYEEGQAEG